MLIHIHNMQIEVNCDILGLFLKVTFMTKIIPLLAETLQFEQLDYRALVSKVSLWFSDYGQDYSNI